MPNDDILEELHAIREAMLEAAGGDLGKVVEAANARQEASGRKAVTLPPRKVTAVKKKAS